MDKVLKAVLALLLDLNEQDNGSPKLTRYLRKLIEELD